MNSGEFWIRYFDYLIDIFGLEYWTGNPDFWWEYDWWRYFK